MQISYGLHEIQAPRRWPRSLRRHASWLVMPRPSAVDTDAAHRFFEAQKAATGSPILARVGLTREQVARIGGAK